MFVVINPGHVYLGKGNINNTPGKCSPDGKIIEALWNKEVAHMVSDKLTSIGIDNFVAVAESESQSLKYPVRVCNDYCGKLGPNNVLFVSIHVNASGNGSWMQASGWSVYTTKGKTKSDDLAECFYDVAKKVFLGRKIRCDYSDGDSDYESDFYVIKNTRCPSVLIENFFMDNKSDCEFLQTRGCKLKCAQVIVEGIHKYIKDYESSKA